MSCELYLVAQRYNFQSDVSHKKYEFDLVGSISVKLSQCLQNTKCNSILIK